LLDWQRDLQSWPRGAAHGFPDATPFVTLYSGESLWGCQLGDEGGARERLVRAYLRALADPRAIGSAPNRRMLSAEVSYPLEVRRLDPDRAELELEVGTEGLVLVAPDRSPVVLLPRVACDLSFDAKSLIASLASKAGCSKKEVFRGTLYAFTTENVSVRIEASGVATGSPLQLAARWLAARVDVRGSVDFAIDARRGIRERWGEFAHGRAAIVVQALASAPGGRRAAARARRRLEREIKKALAGHDVVGWPAEPARIGGTLALASLAGIDVQRPLEVFARRPELRRDAWHGAQVVAALGADAPIELWRACVADLDARPWAPWSALAARARGDAAVAARCERALVDSLRRAPPHAGGASVTTVPELALTAIAVEALSKARRSTEVRAAMRRAREFIESWQLVGERIPIPLDPRLCSGAFPASPIVDWLRTDVTAHALLALRASSSEQ